MQMPAQMLSQRDCVLPQRQFRKPIKRVDIAEQTDNERPPQRQPDTERYQLQIDRQTKRSFKTPEAAQTMALEIKARFPILQVSIYDSTVMVCPLVSQLRFDSQGRPLGPVRFQAQRVPHFLFLGLQVGEGARIWHG